MGPIAVRRRMTQDEYFELLETSGERLEYWDGVVEGMAGGTEEHSLIETNLFGQIFKRLEETSCFPQTSNQAIYIGSKSAYVFADLSVVCGGEQRVQHRGISCITNPTVVVEILSPSTSMKDESEKFHGYTSLRSVREYLLVSASEYSVKLHARSSADEIWKTTLYLALDDEFELKSCGVRMRVRDVYGPRVSFSQ